VIVAKQHLQLFSRYWALSISGPWPWPFRATWHHRARDHSIPHSPFLICLFKQFFGRTHRLATIHTLQKRQTDEHNTVA